MIDAQEVPQPSNGLPRGWEERPTLRESRESYERYRVALVEALAEREALEPELEQATAADRQVRADAHVNDQLDPGSPETDRVQTRIDEIGRRIEDLREGATTAATALDNAYTAERTGWREEQAQLIVGLQGEICKHLDLVDGLLARLPLEDGQLEMLDGPSGSSRRHPAVALPNITEATPAQLVQMLREWVDQDTKSTAARRAEQPKAIA